MSAPSAMPAVPRSRLERAGELLFGAALAVSVALVLLESALRIAAPYQVEFGEGNVLVSALRAARGQPVYPIPAAPPYVFSSYGPLLYGLLALLVRAFGVSFAAPRLLGALAMCGIALLLFLLLRRWTGSARVALLFGPLFLALPEVGLWSAVTRADPLAVLLALAGLYAIATAPRRWPAAALLFLAAGLVKPTLVAAPAAAFLYLLLRREPRRALALLALTGGLALAAFAALQLATGGGFAFQLLRGHPEPYSLARYLRMFALVTSEQLIPVALLLLFVLQSWRRRALSLPLLYAATALLGTLTAGMAGAASNHFLEWSAVVCLGAGMAYHDALARPPSPVRALATGALFAMVACALAFSTLVTAYRRDLAPALMAQLAGLLPYHQRLFPLDARLQPDCAALQAYLAARPGELVLSENTGAALLAGKQLAVTDPYAYTQLVLRGKLDPAPLVELVRARRFAAIVMAEDIATLRTRGTDRWAPALLAAAEQAYTLDRRFECANGGAVYLPAP